MTRPHERPASEPLRVLAWPRWLGNPYLPRLLAALRDEGLDARVHASLTLGSLSLRAGDWLHLHWPGEAYAHRARWLYKMRARAMRSLLRRLKRRGVRIAWTAHNMVPHDDPHPDLGRRARRELLALVDHVFVHFAGAQAELAETFGYTGPVTVVHHPHYADTYPAPPPRAEARARLGLPADGFVALAFGLIRPYKGVGTVITAFQQIARADDRLVLAGAPEGDVAAELALGADDPRIVVHARRIDEEEVPYYFAAADVTVIAHRAFFTSGSALLGLSMGTPIVGPPIHHLADLAGGQRLFPAEPGVAGLAAALARAREAAPTIDRAAVRAWAEHHGTWRVAAARIAAVFRDRDTEPDDP